MQEIKYSELDTFLKNKELNFYNIYNSDLNTPIYYSTQHYINNPDDNTDIEQKLHILFVDIEVYWHDKNVKFEFDVANHPINALTVYSTELKIFKSFYLLYDFNYQKFGITPNCNIQEVINNHIINYKTWLLKEKYVNDDDNIEINIYNNELQLLLDAWAYIRNTNCVILSGFNSDNFDYPYIYKRLLKLYNDDKPKVDSIISQFGLIEFNSNGFMKIIDYPICDIQYCYKIRGDGGLNLGKKLPSYSLDFISDEELGLTKLEYKNTNIDLHEFYENDPINYLLYNIADVCLCVKLNEKLRHIELQNLIRRNMKLNFSQSLIGSSALYDSFILYELLKSNKKIRHGLVTESGKELLPDVLSKIPVPTTKNNKVKPDKIARSEYLETTYSFEGAYVKDSNAKIIDIGIIMDLDASGLYPSMIRQFNIGFDTYKARIISPLSYKTLTVLEEFIGVKPLPSNLFQNIYSIVDEYIEREGAANKTKAKNKLFYIISHHIYSLAEKNIKLEKLYKPSSIQETILLKQYLIPLVDLIDMIHIQHESYNEFVYDYIFDPFSNIKEKYKTLYLINNAGSSDLYIEKLNVENLLDKLKDLIITINGACYLKHESKMGIFVNFLNEMSQLRKSYRSLASNFVRGTEKYNFYNTRQLAIKVLMNSAYGVLGLKTFRYSNNHLAQSITSSGKLTIKLAQYLTNKYLTELEQ
jgi:DNA polymerase elongation subunit (family B)